MKFALLMLLSFTALAADPETLPENCVDPQLAGKLKIQLEQSNTLATCALRPVEKVVKDGFDPQVWYVSDGSCIVDSESIAESYQKVRDWLLTPQNYSQKNGGLDQVLEFLAVDHATGKPFPKEEQGQRSLDPFHAFVGLKGVGIAFIRPSYYYYVHNIPEESIDQTEFILPYRTLTKESGEPYGMPEYLKKNRPELYWIEGGKKKKPFKPSQLDRVVGQWCVKQVVDENGEDKLFLRYYTAADIGLDFSGTALKKIAQKAHAIHQATLEHLAGVAQ